MEQLRPLDISSEFPMSNMAISNPTALQSLKSCYPPDSWRFPAGHLEVLLGGNWYPPAMRLLNTVVQASHRFFYQHAMAAIVAPTTTTSVSSPMGLGSDSLPVRATIGGRTIYMSDSMQFALELGLRVLSQPVYYIMPSFRGEEADARHLNQFVHAEAEIRGGLDDVMLLVESYLRALSLELIERSADDLAAMDVDLEPVIKFASTCSTPKVTFSDAVRLLSAEPDNFQLCDTGALKITNAGERALIKLFEGPVWLTHMPMSTVPFYQARVPDDPDTSLTADLLMGIGETVGAGERARTEAQVAKNLRDANVEPSNYDWYLRMKAMRPERTSGFGLGIERFLAWATGHHDIRNWCFLIRNTYGEGNP